MKLLPIVEKARLHAESTPPYEWCESNTPQELLDFQRELRTSSDDFWYCLTNGYIAVEQVTDTPLDELTYADIRQLSEIIDEYGIEF